MSASETLATMSVPYGQPGAGFWGEKTSTLNFCEEVRALLLPAITCLRLGNDTSNRDILLTVCNRTT